MKNTIMRNVAVSAITTVVSLSALPLFATPVFAEEGGLTCVVKTHEDGSTYTECDGSGQITAEQVQQALQQTQQAWEQETGYTYGVNINDQQQVATVRTCQDDGYSADYYWSESAQACVTDYVAPTPVATTAPAPTPTSSPISAPVAPTVTVSQPEATRIPETSTSTWNYIAVANSLLERINNQRVAVGLSPLTLIDQATADATQRANESMDFAKQTTAYGTTTDGHFGFDTEIGDTEVNSYVTSLSGTETEDEVAETIFTSMTTGLGATNKPFESQYDTVGLGFADSHFTSRFGSDRGYNVWFNLQLNSKVCK